MQRMLPILQIGLVLATCLDRRSGDVKTGLQPSGFSAVYASKLKALWFSYFASVCATAATQTCGNLRDMTALEACHRPFSFVRLLIAINA